MEFVPSSYINMAMAIQLIRGTQRQHVGRRRGRQLSTEAEAMAPVLRRTFGWKAGTSLSL